MPGWATLDPAAVANGLWWVVVALLAAIGGRAGFKGTQAAEAKQPTVELAGAVLDFKSFQNLIDALGMNTVALTKKGLNLEKNSEALDAHRATLDRAMKQTDETARLIERLTSEIRELREQNRDLRDEVRDLQGVMRQGIGRN